MGRRRLVARQRGRRSKQQRELIRDMLHWLRICDNYVVTFEAFTFHSERRQVIELHVLTLDLPGCFQVRIDIIAFYICFDKPL